VDAGRVVGKVGAVHDERGARLPREFGLDAAEGAGHEPEDGRGHVAWGGGAPGGCLECGGHIWLVCSF
jgi:hypothetical protein